MLNVFITKQMYKGRNGGRSFLSSHQTFIALFTHFTRVAFNREKSHIKNQFLFLLLNISHIHARDMRVEKSMIITSI